MLNYAIHRQSLVMLLVSSCPVTDYTECVKELVGKGQNLGTSFLFGNICLKADIQKKPSSSETASTKLF